MILAQTLRAVHEDKSTKQFYAKLKNKQETSVNVML